MEDPGCRQEPRTAGTRQPPGAGTGKGGFFPRASGAARPCGQRGFKRPDVRTGSTLLGLEASQSAASVTGLGDDGGFETARKTYPLGLSAFASGMETVYPEGVRELWTFALLGVDVDRLIVMIR